MSLHRVQLVLVILFLFGTGFWLTSIGWQEIQMARKLDQNAAMVEGRVLENESHALSKGGQSSTLVVEYVPPGHPAITKTFQVDSADYKKGRDTGRAKVTYLPAAPEVSRVTQFALFPFQILTGLGMAMCLAGLFCLLWWKRHDPRPASGRGETATA